ncbi:MAG: cytochrome ubiquinol oxidase subunit I, partial [Algoriella sp.]
LMMGIAIIFLIAHFLKKDWRTKRWFYKMFMIATPFGYIALEAGWTVTEVGRQPWIIYGIMRTVDSITPMPGIQYSFYVFTFVFITLSIILVFLMNRQIQMVAKLYDPEDPNYKPEKH